MKNTRFPARTLFLFLLSFMFFLCNSSPAFASKTKTAGCHSCITIEKAAALLSVPAADLHKSCRSLIVSPDDLAKKTYEVPPSQCSIRSQANFLTSISYTTYIYNDTRQASIDFTTMKNNFTTTSKVDAVSDLGNEAFWVGDKRFQRLVARQDNIVIDVLSPIDFNQQKKLIQLILATF